MLWDECASLRQRNALSGSRTCGNQDGNNHGREKTDKEMQAHMKEAGHRETQSQEAWQKKVRKQDTPTGRTQAREHVQGAVRERGREDIEWRAGNTER